MGKFVLIVLMLLFAGSLSAQQLSNVDAEQQNKKAVITYDFAAKTGVSDYDIKLFVSADGGKTWQQVLNGLSGDIGKISSSGHKTIVWDVLADRDKLQGEDIRFKVTATFNEFGNYTETAGGVNIEMVAIKGGTFTMGSSIINEKEHQVTVSDFYIGATEVTFEQYDAFCNATGRVKPDDEGWGRGNRPAINVSWSEATNFCRWLSQLSGNYYRLPTEAEWEYACRAGTTTPFNTGTNITTLQANFNNTRTIPVGSYSPNAWGLYDMHSNVDEWCGDLFSSDYYNSSPQINPQGPSSGIYRVYRGGSWYSGSFSAQSANRSSNGSVFRDNDLGFRIVAEM